MKRSARGTPLGRSPTVAKEMLPNYSSSIQT